jgi:hypothetical protein
MEENLATQLLEETLSFIEEDEPEILKSFKSFRRYMEGMLPSDIMNQLQMIYGEDEDDAGGERTNSFLELIYNDRYVKEDEQEIDEIENGLCNICERQVKLTRHHVYPREIHKTLLKKGYDAALLNNTISICRMCHSTIHNFFTNEELAKSYYTVDLLLGNEKFLRYAKWAANQKHGKHHKT